MTPRKVRQQTKGKTGQRSRRLSGREGNPLCLASSPAVECKNRASERLNKRRLKEDNERGRRNRAAAAKQASERASEQSCRTRGVTSRCATNQSVSQRPGGCQKTGSSIATASRRKDSLPHQRRTKKVRRLDRTDRSAGSLKR